MTREVPLHKRDPKAWDAYLPEGNTPEVDMS